MFQRMQDRGQTIIVRLSLQSEFIPNSYSNNVVFDIVGSTFPDQIVIAGGHIDTWDTGSQTGANDDGGGFVTVFEALRLLKKLGYRAKRTLRFIAWSGEESGCFWSEAEALLSECNYMASIVEILAVEPEEIKEKLAFVAT
ncbi:unnamed protein product [Sphagnum balticum]